MRDMGPEYDSGDYSQFLAEDTGEYKDDKKSSMQNMSITLGGYFYTFSW